VTKSEPKPIGLSQEHRHPRRAAAIIAALTLAGLILLWIFDRHIVLALQVQDEAALERRSLYQVFRQMGYVPVWIFVGLMIGLHEWWLRRIAPPSFSITTNTTTPSRRERTLQILFAPALAGLAAEILKVLIRRERPDDLGLADFRPWSIDTFSASGLGLPSSHAAVAFAAAFTIARLFPGTAPIIFPLALGCGITRILMGAHFATDVYVGAIVAYLCTRLVFRVFPVSRQAA
jgi:membrane-associated phospholipid phosphatase